jgi:hypothetical protein
VTPVYNNETGRLEQILSDGNGDGIVDTRAFMDGPDVTSIEIDRDQDGRFERTEQYGEPTGEGAAAGGDRVIARAEETAGNGHVVRRERYERGVLQSVEEDIDLDGRMDKWEHYENGVLRRIDLDLIGRGAPDRRLHYGANGDVSRIEVDPEGDGAFTPLPDTGQPANPS